MPLCLARKSAAAPGSGTAAAAAADLTLQQPEGAATAGADGVSSLPATRGVTSKRAAAKAQSKPGAAVQQRSNFVRINMKVRVCAAAETILLRRHLCVRLSWLCDVRSQGGGRFSFQSKSGNSQRRKGRGRGRFGGRGGRGGGGGCARLSAVAAAQHSYGHWTTTGRDVCRGPGASPSH